MAVRTELALSGACAEQLTISGTSILTRTTGEAGLPRAHGNRWLVPRPALVRRLMDEPASFVCIRAPAGYGKSSLMRLWCADLASQEAVSWLNLETKHGQIDHFLTALSAVAGVQARSFSTFSELAEVMVQRDGSRTIFLDNADVLGGSAVLDTLGEAAANLQTNLKFVLASRCKLPIRLGKLHALGCVAELGVADLRFNIDDIPFAAAGNSLPSRYEWRDLVELTEGWAAGLRLAMGGARRGFEDLDQATMFEDYFEEEVWDNVPQQWQGALLSTSVLDRLHPDLCEVVTGEKGARGLPEAIASSSGFLFAATDDGLWWRCHGLFRQFLQAKLGRTRSKPQIRELSERAAGWLLRGNMPLQAAQQMLLAQRPAAAAKILEIHYDAIRSEAPDHEVQQLLERLPPHLRSRYPGFALLGTEPLILFHEFDHAQHLIRSARDMIGTISSPGTAVEVPSERLRGALEEAETLLTLVRDDVQGLNAWLDDRRGFAGGEVSPGALANFYCAAIVARRERYKLAEVPRLEAAFRSRLREFGRPELEMLLEGAVGPAHLMAGDAIRAEASLVRGMELAEASHGRRSRWTAMMAMLLTRVLFERDELGRVAQLTEEFDGWSGDFGFVDALITGWVTRSRMIALFEGAEAALHLLDDAKFAARQRAFDRLQQIVASEQIRLLISLGRPHDAIRIGDEIGLPRNRSAVFPGRVVTTRDEVRALCWARLATLCGRRGDAVKVCEQWRSFVAGAGAIRSVIRWDMLLVTLQAADGESRLACRTLRRALVAAAPQGLLRNFLDEGAAIGNLLLTSPNIGAGENAAVAEFTTRLIDRFSEQMGRPPSHQSPAPRSENASGELSPNEIKILKLSSDGMLYREIGATLSISEGTVKWYMHQIYAKLGVNRRVLAIDVARRLGLLV